MELQKYFGIHEPLTERNADEVYATCNEKLQKKDLSVRGIIKQSNVKLICTTDDPIDSLEWHQKLAEDDGFETTVLPVNVNEYLSQALANI